MSRSLYNERAQLWTDSETFPWPQFYRFAAIPAILTAVVAFSILVLGFLRSNFSRYRKLCLFLVLNLLIGPCLLSGTLLSQIWERPRPDDMVELGGSWDNACITFSDPATQANFPTGGLSSTAFYFFGFGILLLAHDRRKSAAIIILAAGIYGFAVGTASVVKGASFAGDLLISAIISWLCAAFLFHILGLRRGVLWESTTGKEPLNLPGWVSCGILTATLSIVGIICLAFPSSTISATPLLDDSSVSLPDTVYLDLNLRGTLEISGGDTLGLETEFRGIGLPGSHVGTTAGPMRDGARVVQRSSGHFTRINVRNRITLPPNRVYRITLGKKVVSVAVLPPTPDRKLGFFAHVWLTSGFQTKLLNIKGKAVAEDFFGRRTRAFRVE